MNKIILTIFSLFLSISVFSQEEDPSMNLTVPYYEAVDQWVI
ncbi:hypothetical protein [Dokdonia sp.]